MPPYIGRTSKVGRLSERAVHAQSIGIGPFPVGQSTLSVAVGNLVDCAVEGLVCYASSSLALHSVVASKLVEVGGASIRSECTKHLPTEIGDAVVLSAGKLAARYILVAVTNHIKAAPTITSIRASVQSAIERAEVLGLRSIALPTIRVSKQVSPDDALLTMLAPLVDHLCGATAIQHVVLVIDDLDDFPQLDQYLPACLDRLRAVGTLRAIARSLRIAEESLRKTQKLLGAFPDWSSLHELDHIVRRELAIQQQAVDMLYDQQNDIGARWQATHQAEIDLTQNEIVRLQRFLEGLASSEKAKHIAT